MSHNIVTSLSPLYYLLRSFGLLYFRFGNCCEIKETKCPIYNVFTGVGHLIAMLTNTLNLINVFTNVYSFGYFVILGFFFHICNMLCYCFVIFLSIYFGKTTAILWKRLVQLDSLFQAHALHINYKFLRYVGIASIFVRFSWIAFYLSLLPYSLVVKTSGAVIWTTIISLKQQYTTMNIIFAVYFEKINEKLKKSRRAIEIKNCATIHQKLCKITREYNRTMSVQNLLILATDFVTMVEFPYFLLSKAYGSKTASNWNLSLFITSVSILARIESVVEYIAVGSYCVHKVRGAIIGRNFKIFSESTKCTILHYIRHS